MRQADLAAYLLARPGAMETHPFGAEPDVYKVSGKIFAIFSRDVEPMRISLKCDPDLAEALRRAHPAVSPGTPSAASRAIGWRRPAGRSWGSAVEKRRRRRESRG